MMAQQKSLTLDDINIRDPFILPVEEEGVYYMYSSSSVKENGKTYGGVVAYKSKDLTKCVWTVHFGWKMESPT